MEQFKVLLIERNSSQSCYERLSLHWGADVLTVANNENEALIALLYTRFDLVLLDAVLANENIVGFIKSSGGHNSKTPVVILMDGEGSHLKSRLTGLEIDDCWRKPVDVVALEQFIARKPKDVAQSPSDYVNILLEKTQDNRLLANTIFSKLFVELPVQMMDIKNALQNSQYQAALEITHKLHGSVSFCGFTDLQRYAYELENCLLHKEYQSLTEKYMALKQAIVDFVAKQGSILVDSRLLS